MKKIYLMCMLSLCILIFVACGKGANGDHSTNFHTNESGSFETNHTISMGDSETQNDSKDDTSNVNDTHSLISLDRISNHMSAEEKLNAVSDECSGMLEVSMNPTFELYVIWDDSIHEMRVIGVRPTNNDAETLFQTISVSNQTLWDAMFAIFNKAKELGYLKTDSTLTVDYYGQVHNLEEVIPILLDEYQRENGISFSYQTSCTQMGASSGTDDIMIDVSTYDTVEYGADGNIVKAISTEEWCTTTWHFDSNGILILEVVNDKQSNAYWERYYTCGVLSKSYSNTPPQEVTQTFDSNGNVLSEIDINKEIGLCTTRTFDNGGNLTSQIIDDKSSGFYREEFYSDGILTQATWTTAEEERSQSFDLNGNMISESVHIKEDNSYVTSSWTYFEDGRLSSYTTDLTNSYYSQGYHKEEHYYSNGTISMSYEVSQYGDNKFYYDSNGNVTRYEGKDNHGNYVEETYSSGS